MVFLRFTENTKKKLNIFLLLLCLLLVYANFKRVKINVKDRKLKVDQKPELHDCNPVSDNIIGAFNILNDSSVLANPFSMDKNPTTHSFMNNLEIGKF